MYIKIFKKQEIISQFFTIVSSQSFQHVIILASTIQKINLRQIMNEMIHEHTLKFQNSINLNLHSNKSYLLIDQKTLNYTFVRKEN